MSEGKMQFIERMMNDPDVRQRLKASEQRRAYCEEEWLKQEGASETDQAAPEPVPDLPDPDHPSMRLTDEDVTDGGDEAVQDQAEVDDDQAEQADQPSESGQVSER